MLYSYTRQILLSALALQGADAASWKDYQPQNRTPSSCPDYVDYSQKPHEPLSSGKLKLPFMRPSVECRTFKSPAVEVRPLARQMTALTDLNGESHK
jgi:hypothetical protein